VFLEQDKVNSGVAHILAQRLKLNKELILMVQNVAFDRDIAAGASSPPAS